ncbi:hypothetical protein E6H31_03590 [Candidatus Bathyarchaeota archaeon]|nr:MAG: hypothetical protein E6H31_03590 [Candidatus Bathyarchaeota archaeon]
MAPRRQRLSDTISPELLREARTRQRDEKWLSSASTPILRRYHGKYVAVKNRKILASSLTMNGLYEKIDKLNPGMVLITKIEKPSLLVYVELH